MKLQEILEQAVRDEDVSDVFLVAGLPVTMKRNGRQVRAGEGMLMPKDIEALVEQIYSEGRRTKIRLERGEDDDFSLSVSRRERHLPRREIPRQYLSAERFPGGGDTCDTI